MTVAGSGWRLGRIVLRGAEGATTVGRERATELRLRCGPGLGLPILHTSIPTGSLVPPTPLPILMFMVVCAIIFVMLLFFGSAYLYWSWLNDNKQATQHAEHLRELRYMKQLHARIIRRMDNEDHPNNELARKSLGGTPGTGSEGCAGTLPKIILISSHEK